MQSNQTRLFSSKKGKVIVVIFNSFASDESEIIGKKPDEIATSFRWLLTSDIENTVSNRYSIPYLLDEKGVISSAYEEGGKRPVWDVMAALRN